MTLHPDGKTLIAGTTILMLYDISTDDGSDGPKKTIGNNDDITEFVDVSISKDGSTVAAINNRNVFVFNYRAEEETTYFARAHDEDLRKVAVTSDNEYIITGGHSIKVWSLTKRELIANLEGANTNEITGLNLTGGDRFVIAGKNDQTIEIWDWRFQRLIHVYRNPYSATNVVTKLSDDGKYIVSAGDNSQRDVVIFHNLFLEDHLIASVQNVTSLRSRLGFFVLDGFLDLRGRSQRVDLIRNYPEMTVYPYDWNLLHLAAIYYPEPKTMKECVENKISLTLDSNKLTPIHHLFKKDKLDFDLISYLLTNFSKLAPVDNEYNLQQIIESFSDIFLKIMRLNDANSAEFLSYFLGPPLTVKNYEIPRFGKIKKGAHQCWSVIDTPYFTTDVKDNFISYSSKPVTIRMLRLKMDYDPLSDNMLKLAHALEKVDHEEIFQVPAIHLLVNYIWDNHKSTYYGLILAYSVYMILFSIWAGDGTPKNDGVSIVSFIFGISFLLYEIIQFFVLGVGEYCGKLWNVFDFLRNILMIVTFGFIWNNADNFAGDSDLELARKWLVSLTLLFGYIKWVKLLKVAKQTRLAIRLVTQVFKDLLSWGIIVVFTLFAFALIYRQFLDNSVANWETLLHAIYFYLYGGFDATGFSGSQWFFLILFTILLLLVLINILTALVIDSLEKVKYQSLVVDAKEKLRLAMQATIFGQFICACRKKNKSKFGYLLYIGEHSTEGRGILSEEWEGGARITKRAITKQSQAKDLSGQGIKEELSVLVEQEMSKQREFVRKQIKYMVDYNKELREDLRMIMEKVGIPYSTRTEIRPSTLRNVSPEREERSHRPKELSKPTNKYLE